MDNNARNPHRSSRQFLSGLEPYLNQHILGQPEACRALSQLIWESELELIPSEQPRGSAIFLGPTGVGKTELVRVLTKYLHPEDFQERLIYYDMANYSHPDSLPLLIGGEKKDPGLWGDDLDRMGSKPAILLLDELEKAHPTILPLFLAMLDHARLTCADGISRTLHHHYLFFTSNLASSELAQMQRLPKESLERKVFQAMERQFSPEFCGRFHLRIVMNPLSPDTIRSITLRTFHQHYQHLQQKLSIPLELHDPEVLESFILGQVTWRYQQQKLGARVIRQTVQSLLNQALIQYWQHHQVIPGATLWITLKEQALTLTHQYPASSLKPSYVSLL